MAKPNWLTITPASGGGDADVSISATPHTGRVVREYSLTITPNKGQIAAVSGEVSQTSKTATNATDFVNFTNPTAAVDKNGGELTITGVSNAEALTFSLGQGDVEISIPASYLAASKSTNNGDNIEGDPGASTAYNFSITLQIPANSTTTLETAQLVVNTSGGASAICNIEVAAGDPYLWVETIDQTSVTISIPQDGTAQTIHILSNVEWTVE